MNLIPTALPGAVIIEPERFGDNRGFFSETYNRQRWSELGIDAEFVQDNHSRSTVKGTIRGMHWQKPPHAQAKLIRVVQGAILDVVVDVRRASPTFGQHVAVELSADNWRQFYVPAGFAHGFCTLTDEVEVVYKVTDYYSPADEGGIRWDDPALELPWPVRADGATLSARDLALPVLAEAQLPDFPFGCAP